MKTKYDWSCIRQNIKFMATDKNGWTYGYVDKPKIDVNFGVWSSTEFVRIGLFFRNINWQDSLEERPSESN